MRSRNLKPGFFKNECLARCEPLARLLWQGLWCVADREGRFEWRPLRMKAEILPYDNCDIDELLDQLIACQAIVKYSVNGNNYGAIPTFLKHQKPHVRESASSCPAPTLAVPRHNLGDDEHLPRSPESLLPLTESLKKEDDGKPSALSIFIPLRNGEFELTENQVREYQDAYPSLDVQQELKKLRQWNQDNPAKRKTQAGISRHVNSWLSREADKLSAQDAFKQAFHPKGIPKQESRAERERLLRQQAKELRK